MEKVQILGLAAVALILIAVIAVLVYVIVKSPAGCGGCQYCAYQETKEHITKGFFGAADGIMQAAAGHKRSGGTGSRRH